MNDCVFCDYKGPSEVLADYGAVFVIEPLKPVTGGHVLLIPKTHVSDFGEVAALTGMVAGAAANIAKGWPHANLIASKGAAATQTVGHLHFHLIPRREGDGLALPWDPLGGGHPVIGAEDPPDKDAALVALLHEIEYAARHLESIPIRVRMAAVRARNFIPWSDSP